MNTRFGWLFVPVLLLLVAGASVLSYNAGVSHALAAGAPAPGTPAPGTPPAAWAPPYAWHYGWGFGCFGPFLFLLFMFMLLRVLFWGARGRMWCSHGPYGAASWLEDWHRRAHERTGGEPPTARN